jgi:hypothetical protein
VVAGTVVVFVAGAAVDVTRNSASSSPLASGSLELDVNVLVMVLVMVLPVLLLVKLKRGIAGSPISPSHTSAQF